jgi:hypothetical protein
MAEQTNVPSEYWKVVQQAVMAYRNSISQRPTAERVVNALLQLEKAAKQGRSRYPFAGFTGEWRLCFTTGVRKLHRGGIALGKGFYLPKFAPATIGFAPGLEMDNDKGQISNQIQFAGLTLRFTGPTKYLEKKNLLAFDFTQIQIIVGDRRVYTGGFRGGKTKTGAFEQLPIAQLPFFAFFLVTEDFIAARGRGGGLALWIREANRLTSPLDLHDRASVTHESRTPHHE